MCERGSADAVLAQPPPSVDSADRRELSRGFGCRETGEVDDSTTNWRRSCLSLRKRRLMAGFSPL
jgi:hypothetical protein